MQGSLPPGSRARWPDLVIAVTVVALLFTGIWALFGQSLRTWLHGGGGGQRSSPSESEKARPATM